MFGLLRMITGVGRGRRRRNGMWRRAVLPAILSSIAYFLVRRIATR